MSHILVDGYNLGMEKGTGIATYARNLAHEVGRLGHRTSILYGHAHVTARDPLLREIAFFEGAPPRPPRRRAAALADILSPRAARPVAVPTSGAVVTRGVAALPHHDALLNVPDLFHRAYGRFHAWRAITDVRLADACDIAHWTYPLPLRARGSANLYTLHDLVPLRLPYTTLDDKRRYLALIRRLARTADHIVTVSERSRRDLVELAGVAPDRVTNTYQSVAIPDAILAKPEDQVAREIEIALGLDPGGYFLFWGSIEPKKNVGRLLDAYLASGSDTPLVVVGARAWRADKEAGLLDALARNGHGRSRRVVLLPYAPSSLLVSLIRGARAALFPSLYEGFGLPALEAMLLGTPVLCANTASLPEVAGDAALAVDPYDVEAIAAGLRALDADADLRADLAVRGRAQAALFSPARYRARLATLYQRFT